jgi:hypothetical protein
MPAEGAGRERRAVAERAVMAPEGGEYDAALGRFVSVLDEEGRHAYSVGQSALADIGTNP